MKSEKPPVIFTPDNEPYLGRKPLLGLDVLICAVMEQNAITAPQTHGIELTDHQQMACQVISQALSITLSIRELIRQGYLFGGHVLHRALAERAVILIYLSSYPEDIKHWKNGWHLPDAPGLSKMIDEISKTMQGEQIRGKDVTKAMNSLIHGKPDSAYYNLTSKDAVSVGFAPSKILDRPELCDELCSNVILSLAMIQRMMSNYFPTAR